MSWLDSVSPKGSSAGPTAPVFGVERLALAQLGALSPLWMMFMGASSVGMAYWGMTRWMTLAMPERAAAPVVKLRLVKSEPRPLTVPTPMIAAPAPVATPEPVSAPEPVAPQRVKAKTAPAVKAEPAKRAAVPKPKVAKPAAVKAETVADAAAVRIARKAPARKPSARG